MSPIDVEKIFTYHPPKADQIPRYNALRMEAKGLAERIIALTPVSAEQTLAIRKLQECVMWANASIAINEAEGGADAVDRG